MFVFCINVSLVFISISRYDSLARGEQDTDMDYEPLKVVKRHPNQVNRNPQSTTNVYANSAFINPNDQHQDQTNAYSSAADAPPNTTSAYYERPSLCRELSSQDSQGVYVEYDNRSSQNKYKKVPKMKKSRSKKGDRHPTDHDCGNIGGGDGTNGTPSSPIVDVIYANDIEANGTTMAGSDATRIPAEKSQSSTLCNLQQDNFYFNERLPQSQSHPSSLSTNLDQICEAPDDRNPSLQSDTYEIPCTPDTDMPSIQSDIYEIPESAADVRVEMHPQRAGLQPDYVNSTNDAMYQNM